jgi:L-histidine N-alpha-methyltransferase
MRAGGLTRSPAVGAGARNDAARAQFAADVRAHLLRTPRQLPTRYLYDDLGSALFEAICRLPWYRITRAEERLLGAVRDELAQRLPSLTTIVELGPGSGNKLRGLVGAPALSALPLSVHLIDLSCSALEISRRTLAPLANVDVVLHEATYEAGLAQARRAFGAAGRALALFLGSNIGNFDPEESRAFLHGVRASLRDGDALLLGTDLIKPERELVLAYDDPLGVTAAFNKNLLLRINRELGADFDVPRYAHRAVWNEAESRIEMHLVAESGQRVRVPAADLEVDIDAGESLWTESSYKYTPRDVDGLLEPAGFRVAARWTDHVDGFALTLAEAT